MWASAERKAAAGLVPLPVTLPHHPEIGPVQISLGDPPAPKSGGRPCDICGARISPYSKSGHCRSCSHKDQHARQREQHPAPREQRLAPASPTPQTTSLDALVARLLTARAQHAALGTEIQGLEREIRRRLPPGILPSEVTP